MSLVHNERTKLLANALDRASTACLTVGVLAPVAAALYSMGNMSPSWVLILTTLSWLAAAAVLHYAARRALGGLK